MWFLLTNIYVRNNRKQCTATSALYLVILAPIESYMCSKRFGQLRVSSSKETYFQIRVGLNHMLTTYLCIEPVF